jgi:hypothetical protein
MLLKCARCQFWSVTAHHEQFDDTSGVLSLAVLQMSLLWTCQFRCGRMKLPVAASSRLLPARLTLAADLFQPGIGFTDRFAKCNFGYHNTVLQCPAIPIGGRLAPQRCAQTALRACIMVDAGSNWGPLCLSGCQQATVARSQHGKLHCNCCGSTAVTAAAGSRCHRLGPAIVHCIRSELVTCYRCWPGVLPEPTQNGPNCPCSDCRNLAATMQAAP